MNYIKLFAALIVCVLLTGCLYPEERLAQNSVPYDDQIVSVQNAVDRFQEESGGLLPIKTRDMATPIYQKYPIDFNKLAPKYMAEPPGTSFENGGIYLYVLVNVEEDPTVKLIDLRISEKIRDLNLRLNVYRQSNGYPPYKEQITGGVYTLDYKELGYEQEPTVQSPYSGEFLPLVIDSDLNIYVDYRLDLYKKLSEKEHSHKQGEDIRSILVNDSPFVPVYSLPYTVDKKNEPIFMADSK
ncbi:hypothetical protein [Metabacillus fastidiosus]|uniref:hypothetical protein n=1 Tax=Metabacillus fastidiosus TaxID=1458 RepID=UPI003D2E814C